MSSLVRIVGIVLFIVTVLAGPGQCEREVLDRIVAIVGDKVILASELASQIQMYALQMKQQPTSEEEAKKIRDDILEKMISDRLFLLAAEQDTAIKVRPEEVDQALDEQIARIAQNFPSNDDFLAALSAEGLTLRDLKKRYRNDIEGQLLKQRFIGSKVQTVSVSRHEVEEFYNKYKDSIPSQPEAVKLAHILLEIKPSQTVEDSIKARAMELRKRILNGADFAFISSKYSDLGAGVNGGDLGWVSRGDVVEEFARAAFNLSVGDISGVIRTQFGYHIIKCEGKRNDQVKLRHILLAVVPSAEDSLRTRQLADSLLEAARNGADFALLAKKFSDDPSTRAQGGSLGWFAINELPPEFASAVSGWKTPGEYKGPIYSKYGIHILKLLDYQPEHQYTFPDDYDQLKELTRQEKTSRLIDNWIAEIRKQTYIDYRFDEDAN